MPSGLDPGVSLAAALDAIDSAGVDVTALLLTGDLTDAVDPAFYARQPLPIIRFTS